MKMIHCADLHLDSKLSASLTGEKASARRRELTGNFRDLVELAAENDVRAILICGDLFDTAHVSRFTENMVLDAVREHPGILFYYLKGNHDGDIFAELSSIPSNLFLFTDEWTVYDCDGVRIYGIELDQLNNPSALQNFAPDPRNINIVMLHGQEAESVSKDRAEVINLRLLKNKGIDYLALGHIHEYRAGQLDAMARYCYPGCLEGRGFDEAGEHGFVLLDIDTENGIVKDSFVPFAKRRIYVCPVDITGLLTTSDILGRVKETLADHPAGERDYLKIVLTGTVDVECEKNTEFIEQNIGRDHYVTRVSDETAVTVDLGKFEGDETLKGEFVRLVMASGDLSPERKGEIVRLGLSYFSEAVKLS